jgi:putative hydrolase of the HAD superfamily
VFDLFGTLVDNNSFVGHPSDEWISTLAGMAEAVGADPAVFATLWAETTVHRMVGAFPTVKACLEHLCGRLGLQVDEDCLQATVAMRMAFMQAGLVARPDAVDTLRELRSWGVGIAVISNCGPDIPLLWDATPLAPYVEVPIFSAAVGVAKPDPRIYRLACERLGVAPEHCLYVGDGEGGELAGAAAVGLTPVLIRCSYQDEIGVRRAHVEPWNGPCISWLREVPLLLR